MSKESIKYISASLILIIISALLVWLPNTNTLLDPWRVVASFLLGIVATFVLIAGLASMND